MKIQDKGIFFYGKPLGDNNLIGTFFTEKNGLFSGIIKSGNGKKNRANYQAGNIFSLIWFARLEQQLGTFSPSLEKALSFEFISSPQKLSIINSISYMLKQLLAEKESHEKLFNITLDFLEAITGENKHFEQFPLAYELKERDRITYQYLEWELSLLSEIGFGLDFFRCNATGATEDLIYLSPKTGKAICATVGNEYKEKLFLIPKFIVNDTIPTTAELKELAEINKFFIKKNALEFTNELHAKKIIELRENIF